MTRVGDVPRINNSDIPIITQSMGTTRILYPGLGAVSPDRPAPARKEDPTHTSSFGAVFVNDTGREAMSNPAAKFPTGSIIVREKLSASPLSMGNGPSSPLIMQPKRIEDLGAPLILVVMLKRESGFNPKANDWEFLTVSGDGSRIEKRETKGACLKCHKSEAKRDFVFRDNMP